MGGFLKKLTSHLIYLSLHPLTAKEGVVIVVVVICGFGLCLWFMGLVCASCVLCLEKFMGWRGRWWRERWDYFGFGDLWARDVEGDGMKGRERVDRFFLERRRRLMESFLEKVSGEEIVRNSFSNRVSYWKVDYLSCRLRLCHHLTQFSVSSKPSCFLPWIQFSRSEKGDRPLF